MSQVRAPHFDFPFMLQHMRSDFVCPVGTRRSPIGQACLGALRFITEYELAAQLCMDAGGAENSKVLITPLRWAFATSLDRYKVVGERAAENIATLSAVAGRAARAVCGGGRREQREEREE